jgi:hypothetical protein
MQPYRSMCVFGPKLYGVFSDAKIERYKTSKKYVLFFTHESEYEIAQLNTLWLPIFLTGILKSVWWMPRLSQAMKDAAWRRYASVRCQATVIPEDLRMGKPLCLQRLYVRRERTQGSKTFQYLEEKKTIIGVFFLV